MTTHGGNDRAAWQNAGVSCCDTLHGPAKNSCRLVLLGAPGVGKGTQAELLHQWSGACHLSTGDIFRAAKSWPPSERSPAIQSALDFIARGGLVPDETVLALVRERVRCLRCIGGFLLDGFPRTMTQADALERVLKTEHLHLSAVVDYEMPIEQIVERLAGRRLCARCNGTFNLAGLAAPENCPQCGGQLVQREDDRPEAIRVRMEAYHRSTKPLIEFYRRRGLLLAVSAGGLPPEIFQRTVDTLTLRHSTM